MRQCFKYLILLIFLSSPAFSQSYSEPALPKDTIAMMMLNERVRQAGVSAEFQAAWTGLSAVHQEKVISQVTALVKKGSSSAKLFKAYFSALAHAVNTEGADARNLTDYLNVTERVIADHNSTELLNYLLAAETFFAYHALFYHRSNRLFAYDDSYRFAYVEDPALAEPTEEAEAPAENEEYFDEWDEESTDDEWDTDWDEADEAAQEAEMIEALRGDLAILPVVSGPVIEFDQVTLNFSTPYDSVFLKNTRGSYLLTSGKFVGSDGKFDWSMAGLAADTVFCEFPGYSFDVKHPRLTVEGAKLTYKGVLKAPVDGVFEYKSVKHDTTTDARYPRFISYQSDIPVKPFGESLYYEGGFSLMGSKINSTSVMGEMSEIFVRDEGIRKFRARAKMFQFSDSTVSANRAAIVIYQGKDSIYHPAVVLDYDFNKEYLILQKDKGGYRDTPYSASYFNIDFSADIIRWDINADSLDAATAGARKIVPAYFQSSDHYHPKDYESLGDRIYPFNPLAMVVAFAREEESPQFFVDELAKHYKKDIGVMKGAMVFLSQKGLIGYDPLQALVTVKDKAFHLVDAKRGRKDFDNILISSIINTKPNATLNFAGQYMKVRGVDWFKISDSLNVVIQPDSSEIILLNDRDFMFDGKIRAGKFEYIGSDFTFKYDSFLIYLNKIDSIQLYVDAEKGARNSEKKVGNSLISVDSVSLSSGNIQASSGTLFINRPNNKSARKDLPNYPKFQSGKSAIVYFSGKDVLNGIYGKSIYFLVPPFGIDSLSGSEKGAVGFVGTFVSNGIFPPFKEKLNIMPDLSLGFVHAIPGEGYQLYEGEGRFFNQLSLDKNGLRGNGRIEFLTTTLASQDFIFYPDSVSAIGDYMVMKEAEYNGVIFPEASVSNFRMQWLPRKDSLYVHNLKDPINFYNETASLDGTAIITNKGVFGSGTLLTRGSVSKSEKMTFGHNEFSARHAHFDLKSDNPKKPALQGNDVRLKFNLDENYAAISPEIEGEAAIEFPYAQFKTSITQALWDLEKQTITMKKPREVPLESSYFYTTREDLDSLSFNATGAVYDINTLELKVSGIPYIVVADAKITPENNEVLILENSRIGRLHNTTIVLDTLNEYHKLTDGVIDIISRNEFSGYATYKFVNALNDTIPVKMENFHLEKIPVEDSRKKDDFEFHTVATGAVSEKQNIIISPGMFYKGDMTLYAHKPAMELDGYVKLALKDPDYNTWIEHASSGDQKEVMIPFDKAVTEDGRKLEAGLHFSADDNSLYCNFLGEHYMPGDEDFFIPSGILYFDEANNEYVIEDTLKAAGKSFAGKIFRYNQDTKDIKFEGAVSFMKPTKDVAIVASALGQGNLEDRTFSMNTFMTVAIAPVPSTAFDIMAMDILEIVTNLGAPEGLGDPTQLLYKLAGIIGERPVREYERLTLQDYVPLAGFTKETTLPLVFSDVNLKWADTLKAFYNEGKIGLSNISTTDINAALDGFMEIKKNEAGGIIFNLFLKASPESWFFFSLEEDRLLTFSSNEEYNALISKKSNGRKAKIGDLVFAPADKVETLNFINRFRLQYYGIDEIYDLDSEVKEAIEENADDGFGGKEVKDSLEVEDDGF